MQHCANRKRHSMQKYAIRIIAQWNLIVGLYKTVVIAILYCSSKDDECLSVKLPLSLCLSVNGRARLTISQDGLVGDVFAWRWDVATQCRDYCRSTAWMDGGDSDALSRLRRLTLFVHWRWRHGHWRHLSRASLWRWWRHFTSCRRHLALIFINDWSLITLRHGCRLPSSQYASSTASLLFARCKDVYRPSNEVHPVFLACMMTYVLHVGDKTEFNVKLRLKVTCDFNPSIHRLLRRSSKT